MFHVTHRYLDLPDWKVCGLDHCPQNYHKCQLEGLPAKNHRLAYITPTPLVMSRFKIVSCQSPLGFNIQLVTRWQHFLLHCNELISLNLLPIKRAKLIGISFQSWTRTLRKSQELSVKVMKLLHFSLQQSLMIWRHYFWSNQWSTLKCEGFSKAVE